MFLHTRKQQSTEDSPEAAEAHAGQEHPSALQYAQIGIVLAIITASEVGLYYVDLSRGALVGLLMALSALKFVDLEDLRAHAVDG